MTTFFGGVPTDLDIAKLRETWPEHEMKAGDIFLYHDIAQVLKLDEHSNRFRTVTSRWRKLVEHSVGTIIGPKDGDKFVVMTESEKLNLSRSKLKTSARLARRSLVVLARTDRKELTEKEQAAFDHQHQTSAKVIAAAQLRRRKLELPKM